MNMTETKPETPVDDLLEQALGDQQKEARFSFKVTQTQRLTIERAAEAAGMNLSRWLREMAMLAAKGKPGLAPNIVTATQRDHGEMIVGIGKRQVDHEKLLVELIRLVLEHTNHASPVSEMKAREEAARKLQLVLQRLGLTTVERKVSPIRDILERFASEIAEQFSRDGTTRLPS